MAKCRLMSYLDVGAPQFDTSQRDAMLLLMKMLNETSYNTQYPTSIVVDPTSETLHLNFSAPHGFTVGHLLKIMGTTSSAFQSDLYRVLNVPSVNTLSCKIDNFNSVTYPSTESSSTISVKHAPLEWDVLFSSTKQYSIRSSSDTSSKNILTLKEPELARLKFNVATYSAPACVAVHVSEDLDTSTGAVINSYTSGMNVNNAESLFWNTHANGFTGSAVTPSATNISDGADKLPWFLVGDDKIFYLMVGCYCDTTGYHMRYRNANRLDTSYLFRTMYAFGDPEYLGDPTYIDKYGTYLTANYQAGGTSSSNNTYTPRGFAENINNNQYTSTTAQEFFLRPFDGRGSLLIPVSYSSIYAPYHSSAGMNLTYAGLHMSYPHLTTRGLLFFPIYLRHTPANSPNQESYFRSTLPYAKFCPINTSNLVSGNNIFMLDYTVLHETGKNVVISISAYTNYQHWVYELD